jgi:hypothetical protein
MMRIGREASSNLEQFTGAWRRRQELTTTLQWKHASEKLRSPVVRKRPG